MKLSITELLKNSNFFGGMSLKNQEKLSKIAVFKKTKKKHYIFHEGDNGEYIFFLRSGNIELSKTSFDGKKVVIKVINQGEMFAEVILFENSNYPVSAYVISEASFYCIRKIDFLNLLNDLSFRNEFISILMKKQRYLTERIIYLSVNDVEKRFFNFLLNTFGRKESYHLTISKKDIAAAILTTPESLSRLLLRLKNENVIDIKGKNVVVLKMNYLESFL